MGTKMAAELSVESKKPPDLYNCVFTTLTYEKFLDLDDTLPWS